MADVLKISVLYLYNQGKDCKWNCFWRVTNAQTCWKLSCCLAYAWKLTSGRLVDRLILAPTITSMAPHLVTCRNRKTTNLPCPRTRTLHRCTTLHHIQRSINFPTYYCSWTVPTTSTNIDKTISTALLVVITIRIILVKRIYPSMFIKKRL